MKAMPVGVAEVDRLRGCRRQDRAGRDRVQGDADRPAEVVAAAAGDDAHHTARRRDGSGDAPDDAVAAHRHDDPVVGDGLGDQLVGVLERRGRRDDQVVMRGEGLLDGGQDAWRPRPPPAAGLTTSCSRTQVS